MPIFFIDVYDDDRLFEDRHGAEFDDVREARDLAIALLPDFARESRSRAEDETFKVVVRCRDRHIKYVATLVRHGEWVGAPPSKEAGTFERLG